MGIGGVESRLAAVAPHRLKPLVLLTEVLPRPVVLCAALELVRVERADREALELERREVLVHRLELVRNTREQLVAPAQVRLGPNARGAGRGAGHGAGRAARR